MKVIGWLTIAGLVLVISAAAWWFNIGWWAEAPAPQATSEVPQPAPVAPIDFSPVWTLLALATFFVFTTGIGFGAGVGLAAGRRFLAGSRAKLTGVPFAWIITLVCSLGVPTYLIGSYLGSHDYGTAAWIGGSVGAVLGLLIGIIAEKPLARLLEAHGENASAAPRNSASRPALSRETDGPPCVLVCTWGAESLEEMEQLSRTTSPVPVEWVPVAGGDAVATAGVKAATLVSCVLILTRDAIADPSFGAVVQNCIRLMGEWPDFRLFVHLKDLDLAELRAKGAEVPAVGDLLDSVHFVPGAKETSLDVLAAALRDHLQSLPDLRDRLRRQRWKEGLVQGVMVFNLLLLLQVTITAGFLSFLGAEAKDSIWFPWLLIGLGQMWFLSLLALPTIPFFFNNPFTLGFHLRCIMIAAPIALLWIWPIWVLAPHWPYLLAGFCTSLVMDLGRRFAVRMRRPRLVVDPEKSTGVLSSTLDRPGFHTFLSLANGPLVRPQMRVFLSYARSSAWGRSVAEQLHLNLKQAGIPAFLDAADIPPGTSWRHALQTELANANVLIQVLDGFSATRPWVAAELATASVQQALNGQPTIVTLRHPELTKDTLSPVTPQLVAITLFPDPDPFPDLHRVVEATPEAIRQLSDELKQTRRAPFAILPSPIARVLSWGLLPIHWLLSLLAIFNGAGMVMTVILLGWCWFQGVSLPSWLAERGLLEGFAGLLAFWSGSLTQGGLLHLLNRQSGPAVVAWMFACAGILAIVTVWLLLAVHPLAMIFVLLAFVLGCLVSVAGMPKVRSGQ